MHAEEEYMKLRERVPTNKARLEEEMLETPMLLLEASEHAVDALQLRDACKQDLDRATSLAAKALRESAAGKASEQRILSELPSEEAVVAAAAALEDAKHDAAVWQALAAAFGEKASLLRRVAELVTAGFSGITAPRSETGDVRTAMAERRSTFRPRS